MAEDKKTTMKTSSQDSTHPVLVPEDKALFMSDADFEAYINRLLPASSSSSSSSARKTNVVVPKFKSETETDDTITTTTSSEATPKPDTASQPESEKSGHRFVEALQSYDPTAMATEAAESFHAQGLMLTANQGVAHRSTNDPRLDLFTELEKVVKGERLRDLLEASWAVDPLDTLRIIWNARSIHIGKGERESFYRCIGWLRQRGHLKTILTNLRWAVRPILPKKVEKDHDDDVVMVEKAEEDKMEADYDVANGVAHGYWKDLLNLLVLEVEGVLDVMEDPRDILNEANKQPEAKDSDRQAVVEKPSRYDADGKLKSREERIKEAAEFNLRQKVAARERRHKEESGRHINFMHKFKSPEPPFYRALHLTVARLFAAQLKKDMELWKSGRKSDINHISMAAKWAPSLEHFHDKYTFIASSIAEALYPSSVIGKEGDSRETILKRAREHYRRFTLAPLRKALQVVEIEISAQAFNKIDYERIPSAAMDIYKGLFITKDPEHFGSYLDKVAEGKRRISGAVLLPAKLVKQVLDRPDRAFGPSKQKGKVNLKALINERLHEMECKVVDGQWNTLVDRMIESGKIENSIAVCDVSGSMLMPIFDDGTVPIHSAIGLSLLLSEITAPPFGGHIITFSQQPQLCSVGGRADYRTFTEKVQYISKTPWDGNTDFIAVFEELILPMAIKHKLKQEDMVKQIFVFSDMQFDAASGSRHLSSSGKPAFETHYQKLKKKFAKAGYEIPRLIFWNLAGGSGGGGEDLTAPKPVTKEIAGTALVSGYSQGQMKMFLEGGLFDEDKKEEEEEEVKEKDADDDDEVVEVVMQDKKEEKEDKAKIDPMRILMRAIGHSGYSMLKVVD